MRNNHEGGRLRDMMLVSGIKGAKMVQALGAALAFPADAPFISFIDPGGATRVVTLPDPTGAGEADIIRIIVNTADAAEDLTINDPAATTRGTISQNEFAIIVCDGTRHYVGVVTTT